MCLLVIPIWAIHKRLVIVKDSELKRVNEALAGDRPARLESLTLNGGEELTVTGLIMYRQMIGDVSEWPIEAPEIMRFGAYVIIPFLAWVGAALVERALDAFI